MPSTVLRLRVVLLLLVAFSDARAALAGPQTASETVARAAVERLRDDAHRESVRIDWPQMDDEVPPDGAEMARIDGGLTFEVTRIVLRGAKAEGCSVRMGRGWSYGSGEWFDARSFDVTRDAFTLAWNAARRVEAAEAVRIVGPTAIGGSHRTSTSEGYRCVRLRRAADAAPWHESASRGESERLGVRVWADLRSTADHEFVSGLVPPRDRCAPADLDGWAPWFLAEVSRGVAASSSGPTAPERLFLETSLRGLGEVGPNTALAAVEALESRLRTPAGRASADVGTLLDECRLARTKLRLRHAFDAAEAAEILAASDCNSGWGTDRRVWVRRRWRSADPAGFLVYARSRVADPTAEPARLVEGIEDLASYTDPDLVPIVRSYLPHARADVRAAAAVACLARSRRDDAALDLLVRAQGAGPRLFETDDVLRAAIRAGDEDGRWVHLALGAWHRLGIERDEQVRIWRAMLDRPPHRGTHWAVRHLLDLEDRATYAKLETVTARWVAEATARETVGLSEDAAASLAWFVRAARQRSGD